jgi:hypothetical protein
MALGSTQPLTEMGGTQSRSGRRGEEEILDPTGTRTPTSSVARPVTTPYIEYAIPATIIIIIIIIIIIKSNTCGWIIYKTQIFLPGSNFNNKYFSDVPGKTINTPVCAIHRSSL